MTIPHAQGNPQPHEAHARSNPQPDKARQQLGVLGLDQVTRIPERTVGPSVETGDPVHHRRWEDHRFFGIHRDVFKSLRLKL